MEQETFAGQFELYGYQEFKLKKFNPTGNVQSKKLQNRILKNSGLDGLLVGHLWLEVVLSQYL